MNSKQEQEEVEDEDDVLQHTKKRARVVLSHHHCWETKNSDRDAKWNAMFVRLAVWKNTHQSNNNNNSTNNTNNNLILIENDDTDDPELASWVQYQRSAQGRAALLKNNSFRLRALNGIGFCWSLRAEKDRLRFEERFQQLVEYKKEHGDLLVPTKHHELSSFVNNLRTAYLHKQQAKNGELLKPAAEGGTATTAAASIPKHRPLSDEYEARLNEIGFVWNCKKKRVGWDDRIQELIEYKQRFGHTKVPQHWPENKQLGKWVAKQRANYNLRQQQQALGNNNKPDEQVLYYHSLTDERVAQLNELGFDWGKARPNARRSSKEEQNNSTNDHASSDEQDDEFGSPPESVV